MKLKIAIQGGTVSVSLIERQHTIDSIFFAEERRLSEQLLPAIDRLLKKHSLRPVDISEITLKSDLGPNFTTYRIAKSLVDAWNYGKNKII